jgi:beta-lactamase class D
MRKINISLMVLGALLFAGCHSGIKEKPSWKKYLTEAHLQGCLMLYDNMHDHVSVYPLQGASQRFVPAGSFLIFNTLVALESGLVADTSSLVQTSLGDSVTMAQLFRQQPEWLNEWLSTHVPRQVMQYWLDTVHYGKTVNIDTTTAYWTNGQILISPDEQLGLLIHLYFHELPFHERPQRLVQQLMLKESTPVYSLSYLTAALETDSTTQAWMIGWEEENKHPYFFTIQVQSQQETTDELKQDIVSLTHQWLQEQGFFKGKK